MTLTEQAEQTVEVGSVFVESWGYDQTNVDFYVVEQVSKSGKTVKLRHVASKMVDGRDNITHVVPDLDRESDFGSSRVPRGDGNLITKRVQAYSDRPSLHMTSYSNAYLWDGEPEYETAAGWGR